MISKTTLLMIIAILFLLIIVSGCKENTDLVKCNSDLLICSGNLNTTKSDYSICSSNFKSCSDTLGNCNQKNTELQESYNNLTAQFTDCTNEKMALAGKVQNSGFGLIAGLIIEIILGLGVYCITKGTDKFELPVHLWFFWTSYNWNCSRDDLFVILLITPAQSLPSAYLLPKPAYS